MTLEQIGQKLKEAREAQGVSLRQIYERTRIPLGHLHSIDTAVAEDLPEPVYVAGYIKRYAECLGLDGQVLADEYKKGTEQAADSPGHLAGQQVVYAQREYYKGSKIDHSGPPTFKTFYFNAFWIVVVIGLITYLVKVQLDNQVNQIDPSLVALRQSTTKFNAPLPEAALPAVTPVAAPAVAGEPGARIELSASHHVWVEVKSMASGETFFTGNLEQGDRRDFQDAQGLTVRAGNGGSLTVDYQGKITTFGESGKPAERTFLALPAVAGQATAAKKVESTTNNAARLPAEDKKARVLKDDERHISQAHQKASRRVEDLPSRQDIPSQSLGGGRRIIDVPYRYSEGSLDSQ